MDRRKELKRQYKETPPLMGVYQIRNLINGKVWVTSSMNLHGARNRYPSQLSFATFAIKELKDDWNHYGSDAFAFEVLESIDPNEYSEPDRPTALAIAEEIWLEKLQPYGDKGYNKIKE